MSLFYCIPCSRPYWSNKATRYRFVKVEYTSPTPTPLQIRKGPCVHATRRTFGGCRRFKVCLNTPYYPERYLIAFEVHSDFRIGIAISTCHCFCPEKKKKKKEKKKRTTMWTRLVPSACDISQGETRCFLERTTTKKQCHARLWDDLLSKVRHQYVRLPTGTTKHLKGVDQFCQN